ncbi:hypothetical protein BDQ17DRAFT_726037 [Cyathus striatus]|nr:hypothetical protein BDQ17DRAFT_726037 [Cyathus striatus]
MAYGLVILSVLGFCYSCLESPPRCFLSSMRSVLESRNRDSKNLKLVPSSAIYLGQNIVLDIRHLFLRKNIGISARYEYRIAVPTVVLSQEAGSYIVE